MLQAEQIKNITFEQSVFSGYKKESVDEFLDQVYDSYTKLQNDNNELVKKLKVCVAKIEEYRQDEQFLKSAIVNAQKLNANSVKEIEAKKKETELASQKEADLLVAGAKAEAERILREGEEHFANVREKATADFARQQAENAAALLQQKQKNAAEIQEQLDLLERLKTEVGNFKSVVLNMYKQQVMMFGNMPAVPETAEKAKEFVASVPAEAVAEVEAPVEEPKVEIEEAAAPEPVEEIAEQIKEAPEAEELVSDNAEEESDTDQITLDQVVLEVENGHADVAPVKDEIVTESATVEEESEPAPVEESLIFPTDETDEVEAQPVLDTADTVMIDFEDEINKPKRKEKVKETPVTDPEPISPILQDSEEEEEDNSFFFGTPLIFPDDINEEEPAPIVSEQETSKRFKNLKFGVDFDVRKDK